jgi:hypothetical protein
MENFKTDHKVILAKAAQTAGTSEVLSDVIDRDGFAAVAFVGSIGTANAGNYAKVLQGAASDMADGADLAGTKVVTGDNGDSFLIDVYQPVERYVRVSVTRTASTVTGDIYAVLYNPERKPVAAQGATIDSEFHQSPAEGTA